MKMNSRIIRPREMGWGRGGGSGGVAGIPIQHGWSKEHKEWGAKRQER